MRKQTTTIRDDFVTREIRARLELERAIDAKLRELTRVGRELRQLLKSMKGRPLITTPQNAPGRRRNS